MTFSRDKLPAGCCIDGHPPPGAKELTGLTINCSNPQSGNPETNPAMSALQMNNIQFNGGK
jgi:hypothetical protein